MMRTRCWMGRSRLGVVLLGAGALLGCSDLLGPQKEVAPEAPLPTGIHPMLIVASRTGDAATVKLHLKRIQVSDRIASYQGELKYDGQRLTLSAASVPQGITGAWNEVEKGTVRFAGVSVDGIEGGTVLALSFATQTELRGEQFELEMEELVASERFKDLAPQIQQVGSRPAFSRTEPE